MKNIAELCLKIFKFYSNFEKIFAEKQLQRLKKKVLEKNEKKKKIKKKYKLSFPVRHSYYTTEPRVLNQEYKYTSIGAMHMHFATVFALPRYMFLQFLRFELKKTVWMSALKQ